MVYAKILVECEARADVIIYGSIRRRYASDRRHAAIRRTSALMRIGPNPAERRNGALKCVTRAYSEDSYTVINVAE